MGNIKNGYISPEIKVIGINNSGLICTSVRVDSAYGNIDRGLWDMSKDREDGKKYNDYRSRWGNKE